LSQGIPMILAGDEIAHTQGGNNNAYCQDNEITWINWNLLEAQAPLLSFTRKLIALRRAHPVLRRTRFLHGNFSCKRGIKDITWFTPQGTEKAPEQWMDPVARCIGVLLNGQAGPAMDSHGAPIEDDLLLIILNSHHDVVEFTLPQIPIEQEWTRLIDTADPNATPETLAMGAVLPIKGRSLAVLSLPAMEQA
jgi:isoamylase